MKAYLIPYLGSRPIAAITAQELLGVLRRVEARGRSLGGFYGSPSQRDAQTMMLRRI